MRTIDFYIQRCREPEPHRKRTELKFFSLPFCVCRTFGWHCSRSSEAMLFLAIAYKFSCGRRSTGNEWDFGLS